MAITLWRYGSIVCYEGFEQYPYKLLDRVVEGHTKAIAIYDLLTFRVEFAFLRDLKYLDKPEKIMEYYNAVQRLNSKSVRRAKKTFTIRRDRSSEKSKREQISWSEST